MYVNEYRSLQVYLNKNIEIFVTVPALKSATPSFVFSFELMYIKRALGFCFAFPIIFFSKFLTAVLQHVLLDF